MFQFWVLTYIELSNCHFFFHNWILKCPWKTLLSNKKGWMKQLTVHSFLGDSLYRPSTLLTLPSQISTPSTCAPGNLHSQDNLAHLKCIVQLQLDPGYFWKWCSTPNLTFLFNLPTCLSSLSLCLSECSYNMTSLFVLGKLI